LALSADWWPPLPAVANFPLERAGFPFPARPIADPLKGPREAAMWP